MYQLYWAQETGALAPQILLEEVGADYQRVIIEAGKEMEADYLAINPRGQIPAMVLPDGSLMTESAAMVLHIADNYPESKLLPEPGSTQRAQVYRWLFYAVANLYETDLRLYYSERFTTSPDCADSIKQQARKDMDKAFELIEQQLGDGPYLLGETYSVVDPYLLMLVYWHESPSELLARHAKLKRLCETVLQRPAVQRIWSQHYPAG
ncbi:MAG: glutathione S-transferase family protein [Gammaproteobacteria bacterium]|nr:glutathione S-transferase family protein [Gammaproteobacteria bacterium]